MLRNEAVELINFEAFDENGLVELTAAGTVTEFERFSKLITAVENLAEVDRASEVLERKVAGAIFHLNSQLSASIAGWTPELYEENEYYAQLTQDLQSATEEYFAVASV